MDHPSKKMFLRQTLRAKRRAISEHEQSLHALDVLNQFKKQTLWIKKQHIALYAATDGELSSIEIARFLWQQNKRCYLPITLKKTNSYLKFAPWTIQHHLQRNCLGILEPTYKVAALQPAQALDIVFVPLVGFDHHGHRLGMGGGFYDTTFQHREHWTSSPTLVGLAHTIQYVRTGIPQECHDVKIDALITEQYTQIFQKKCC